MTQRADFRGTSSVVETPQIRATIARLNKQRPQLPFAGEHLDKDGSSMHVVRTRVGGHVHLGTAS